MANIERELQKCEQQYWQALKDMDIETMERLTDERSIVAGAQGVSSMDRKQLREMMQSAPWSLRAFELQNMQVRQISDDVAVVAYKAHEDLTVDGKPVSLDAAETSVWVRRNGGWVCAVHTESIAGDPYGRDRRPM